MTPDTAPPDMVFRTGHRELDAVRRQLTRLSRAYEKAPEAAILTRARIEKKAGVLLNKERELQEGLRPWRRHD